MRFDRILLEKYGTIESRVIDLSDKPGLVVVFGPNEAGKSTLLSAIGDFLYGVPNTSPHGGVFGYPQMAITASLRLADGHQLTLRRKKGRKDVLVDETNTTVSESRLTTILGGADRGRFESLFGLNHASLRQGGHELLAAEGEIGRLIVEAGGGLRGLVVALDDLEAEADTLFATTKSAKRRYYGALDSFDVADKAVRRAVTSRDVFLKAEKAVSDANTSLVVLRSDQKSAREKISHDERLRRIAPQLRLLADVENDLLTFVDIDALPESFAADVGTAQTALAAAQATHAEVKIERDTLHDTLAKQSLQPEIVEAAITIEAALELSQHVAKARLDRPKRLTERADSEARLVTLRQSIGVGREEDLAQRAPTAAQIDAAQSLAAEALTLQADLKAALLLRDTIESELKGLTDRQSERQRLGFDKPNTVATGDLSRLAVLDRDIAARKKAADQVAADIAARSAALGLGEVGNLRGVWPGLSAISAEGERRAAVAAEKARIEETCRTAKARLTRARTRQSKLLDGGVAPTPAAISEARASRDDTWGAIRRVYLDALDTGWVRPGESERQTAAAAFESGKALADGLADRASAESERLSEIASVERDIADATEVLAEEDARLSALVEREAQGAGDWARSWSDVVAIEPDIGRLQVLTTQRDQLQAAVRDLRSSQVAVSELEEERGPLLEVLDLVETRAGAARAATLTLRVQAALSAIKTHDDSYAGFLRDVDAIAAASGRQRLNVRSIADLQKAKDRWMAGWRTAMAAIGLPEDATPKRATEVATQWAAATGVFGAIKLTAKRLERMAEDEGDLDGIVKGLRDTLKIALPADPVAAARAAKEGLDQARQVQSQVDALRPVMDAAELRGQQASDVLDRATSALEALALSAGCAVPEVHVWAERVTGRADAKARQTKIRDGILLAGDGLPLETLREQWRSRDPDVLAAELADLVQQVTARDQEIETAISELQTAERAVKAFLADTSLNALIVEREAAARAMAAAIERYAEVTIAAKVLRAAIDQVRMAQQDPLLLRASALFSACTRGAFAGMGTDVDEKGMPVVVGRRRGGEPVAIAEMSDGTRDQLFLAFRLASIQHYGQSAEPIPFIADDILVHFDDARAAAALELLADSGQQVLLFTHHASVMDAVKPFVLGGRAHLVDLSI